MTKKTQIPNSTIDQIIARARSMKPAARGRFIGSHNAAEITEIHAMLLGAAKPKTPRPVLERKILAALSQPARASDSADASASKPLDQTLEENPVATANAASWDAALPEPGYVPPAGTGEEPAAGDDARDEAPEVEAAPAATIGDAAAPTGEPAPNQAAPAAAPVAGRAPRERDSRLPAVGTVIVKTDRHGAERARCTIVEGGVEYAGASYRSISAAAMAAARDLGLASKTQDGYAFWGLKKGAPRAAKKDAVESLQKAWERYHERVAAAAKIEGDEQRAKVQMAISQHVAALQALAAEQHA